MLRSLKLLQPQTLRSLRLLLPLSNRRSLTNTISLKQNISNKEIEHIGKDDEGEPELKDLPPHTTIPSPSTGGSFTWLRTPGDLVQRGELIAEDDVHQIRSHVDGWLAWTVAAAIEITPDTVAEAVASLVGANIASIE